MITLVISDGEGTTTSVPLVLDEVSIGRKEGNTIRLTERNISRAHCRIQRVNGDFVVRDLQSYNGVLVNGRRIEQETKLKAGDELRIGDYTVHFNGDAPSASKPPSVPLPGASPPPPPKAASEIDDRAEQEPTTVAALPKAPPRLLVLTSSLAGAEFVLPEKGEVRVGRGPELEVSIDHRSVSREHAKLVMDGGRARIVDRESANGVVVNHEKVEEATLVAGDIIELGDVIVRFVAAGESYTFDPEEARALLASYKPRSRGQWALAATILGAALLGAFFILRSEAGGGADEPEVATEPEPTLAPVVEATALAAAPEPSDAERFASLLRACGEAVEGGRFAEGVAHANAALKLRADAAEALACQKAARDNHEQEQMFVRAEAALEGGDVESAWSELLGLPTTGAVASRPAVQKTIAAVAARVLDRASDLARRDVEQASALARSVADREGLDSALRDRGKKLLVRTEAQKPVARAPRAAEPAAPRAASTRPARAAAESSGASAMETASACLARGDNACVIKALAGRAKTAQELGLLIETYRALGDAAAANRNMGLYVQRFPTARRAEAYRQQLARQGGP